MEKLNLTPQEIFDFRPEVDFKGYNAEQVDQFLDIILDDYSKFEANTQELLDYIAELQAEIRELKNQNVELEGKQRVFDLSNTTNYSSVDILKRISRLEEQVLKK